MFISLSLCGDLPTMPNRKPFTRRKRSKMFEQEEKKWVNGFLCLVRVLPAYAPIIVVFLKFFDTSEHECGRLRGFYKQHNKMSDRWGKQNGENDRVRMKCLWNGEKAHMFKENRKKKTHTKKDKRLSSKEHGRSGAHACTHDGLACIYLRLHLHILLGFDTGRKVRLNDMLGETETRGRREAGWQRGGKYQRGEEDRQITREEKD